MTILSKKEMSEEDIKLQYITPAILAKWDKSRITMETRITDGKICLNGNFVHRDKKSAKFADYVLYWSSSFPIAIVEAKDNNHSVSFGLQQAIAYAQMMDVPFVYSSNGDAFYEHDMLTGMEREIALDDFPTPELPINVIFNLNLPFSSNSEYLSISFCDNSGICLFANFN